MIYRKKFYIVLLTLVSAFIMLECSDDNETPVITDDTIPTDEVVETTYKTNPRAFALKFQILSAMVQRTSNDWTKTPFVSKSMKVYLLTSTYQNSRRATS